MMQDSFAASTTICCCLCNAQNCLPEESGTYGVCLTRSPAHMRRNLSLHSATCKEASTRFTSSLVFQGGGQGQLVDLIKASSSTAAVTRICLPPSRYCYLIVSWLCKLGCVQCRSDCVQSNRRTHSIAFCWGGCSSTRCESHILPHIRPESNQRWHTPHYPNLS